MPTLTPQALVDETLSQAPALAVEVFENTLARLTGRHKKKPNDAELGLFFTLAESLRRQRKSFVDALQQRMHLELTAALNEAPEAIRLSASTLYGTPNDLGLIDEQQALEDVAVASVISAIQESSAVQLAQLSRMFDALRGSLYSKRDMNPLRASVFARLLCHTLHEVTLAPAARAAMLRVSGLALAETLMPVYARLCEHMRDADMQPLLAATRPENPPQHVPAGSSSTVESSSDAAPTVPHTLDNLMRLMQEQSAHREDGSGPTTDETTATSSVAASTPFPGLNTEIDSEAVPSAAAIALLSRLYNKVIDDPALVPEMREVLRRLHTSVLLVAEQDAQVLSNQEHPVWQLVNCVAGHSAGFSQPGGERLRAFIGFVESLVARIIVTTRPTATLYWEALREAQQYIDEGSRQAAAKSQLTIEALERSQQREEWKILLHQQVKEQLTQAVVSTTVRAFLVGPWVKAIAEAMVRFGQDAAEVSAMVDLVDDLLWSVQPLRRAEEREQLRQMLPTLSARLQFGFDLIQWPESHRKDLLDELMQRHTRLLQSAPAPHSPQSEMGALYEEDTTPSVHGAMDSLDPRDSRFWADSEIDRSRLATVPVPFDEPDESGSPTLLDAWLVGLRLGTWCHLFVQSRWITSQLTWISDSRNYFVFSGEQQDAPPLSLTRGAVLQLRAAGLLTALEERPVLQRAVDNMIRTLDH